MQFAIDSSVMNIIPSIEQCASEVPTYKASDIRSQSPEQAGSFDLMLAQLMQGIITLPVQAELQVADKTVQSEDETAATIPAEGTITEKSPIPSLTLLNEVQSAFAAAIEGQPAGVAAEGDSPQSVEQTAQTGVNIDATILATGTMVKEAISPSLTMLEAVQSAFATAMEDLLADVAAEDKVLTASSDNKEITVHLEAFTSPVLLKTTSATDEGSYQELIARPDRATAGQNSAEFNQMPVDIVKKAPALEEQQPLVMREIIFAESNSKDVEELTEPQKSTESISLPDNLSASSAAPHGIIRFQAEPAGTVAVSAHELSQSMHVEGNRFVITRLDGTSIEISLQPEGLGKLDIGLMLDKGVVNAQIQTSSAAGKDLVESHITDIINALAKEGITIGGFSVSLKDDRNDFIWSQTQDTGQQSRGESSMANEYVSTSGQVINTGNISIFI